MKTSKKVILAGAILATAATAFARDVISDYAAYRKAVVAARDMFQNQQTKELVAKYGLDLLSVTWEDTGRFKNSSVGPNISDMTIQVHTVSENGKVKPESMPVIRYNNFNDKTADIPTDKIVLLVGNEKGQPLKAVTLNEYLANFDKYLNKAESHVAEVKSLLSPRDTHVLVSPQVSFLPVPQSGKATFNPVLFNYQSSKENPAVLTILATREGTSATIIDNTRDKFEEGFVSGQRLFFNSNGQRASLTGTRLADFNAQPGLPTEGAAVVPTANGQSGLNMVMLIQVPLKHKESMRYFPMMAMGLETASPRSAGVDRAVIGHGDLEGPYTEVDGLKIERDHRFPIRVTVQFYQATDVAQLDENTVVELKKQIDSVFKGADAVGSLVTEGTTLRPTEHKVKCDYPVWWNQPVWPLTLANGETVTRAQAEDFLKQQGRARAVLPRRYPRWYWCGVLSNPQPVPFVYALEMAKTGDFEVKAEKAEDKKD